MDIGEAMKLSYDEIKRHPEVLKAMTSLTVEEFDALCQSFEQEWEKETSQDPSKGGRPARLSGVEDKLLFILFYFKTYPLQEVIGYLFGMSQSQANEWIHRLTKVLYKALERDHYLPPRSSTGLLALLEQEKEQALAIDASERRRERPKEAKAQKRYYSGKKKCHTLKNDLISGLEDSQIKYLSPTQAGSRADKAIADEAELVYPPGTEVYQDKGFQGYAPQGVIIHQPKKKPPGGELSDEERETNRLISRLRVAVEHVIAGVKRVHIVHDVFRNTKINYDDLVMVIACGLHNLRTTYRCVV